MLRVRAPADASVGRELFVFLMQRVHNELWFIRVALLKVIERFVKDSEPSFFTAERLSAILDELQRNLEDIKYAGVRISGMETLDALVTKLDGTQPERAVSLFPLSVVMFMC